MQERRCLEPAPPHPRDWGCAELALTPCTHPVPRRVLGLLEAAPRRAPESKTVSGIAGANAGVSP